MQLVKKVGVIGAGQMGKGIAQVAAFSGYEVILFDAFPEALNKAIPFIDKLLTKGVEKGKFDQAKADEALKNLSLTETMEGLADCDIVIEAATENKEIKFKIFKELDQVVKADAILATNTSSIPITEIATQTGRASQVVGMHFMNPVPVMKLVEGIRGDETSAEVFETTEKLAESMGKVFVKSNDRPGFIINRILMPMINEAAFALYENVATAEDIDTGMKLGTNVPMGPLTLADFIGLDTCLAIMQVLHEGFKDDKYQPCPLLEQYVAEGRLGKKVGKGFYDY